MNDEQWTIIKVLKWTTEYFASRGIEQPRTDAEVLLAHILDYQRLDLYLNFDQPLTKSELAAYRNAIKRRVNHEPVQYITGKQEFWSLPIKITPAVLIPRPETECLVENALEVAKSVQEERKPFRILEIGTGSGAISLALATELPDALIYASDISVEALEIARENAKKLKLLTQIHFFASDLYGAMNPGLVNYFDIVLSNPPYVSDEEYNQLPPEIRNFEPEKALRGGKGGLHIIEKIIFSGNSYLRAGGHLLLEIGSGQGKKLKEFVSSLEWVSGMEIRKDYSGLDRVIIIRKK